MDQCSPGRATVLSRDKEVLGKMKGKKEIRFTSLSGT